MADVCENCRGSGKGRVFHTLPCGVCEGTGKRHDKPDPKPAALSPDMLGEEDRKRLDRQAKYWDLIALTARRDMPGVISDAAMRYESVAKDAEADAALLRRLLGSADAKGGE